MTLRIAKLATRCAAPRGEEGAGALVDAAAREALPRELFERLGPSLDRQPPVVRLRRLDVTVRIDLAEFKRGNLAAAWAAALTRALHEALARPDQDGEMLRRFESRAAYVAAMIASAARGPPDGRSWQFPELAAEAGRHPAIVVLGLLLDSGTLLGDVLVELRRSEHLVRTLALLDEVGLERILRAVAEIEGEDGALNVAQLAGVASTLVALRCSPGGGEAASRRRAIELWLRLDRRMPLRGVWYGTRLLLHFLEEPALLAGDDRRGDAPAGRGADTQPLPPALADIMARFPEWCERLRTQLVREGAGSVASVLEELRQITPTAAPARRGSQPMWLHSDCAGMLLLIPVIRHLGWPRFYRAPGFGARLFQALVAGAAMRLLRAWQPGEGLEPAVGLLAGLVGEPERSGLAQILASTPPTALDLFPKAQDWPEALEAAADALALGLAARIRGFRNAGRSSIVRHFLRIPGRFLIEESEFRIVLEPSPWAVALHVSGADDALDSVEWLGGRRVTYVLEGL